MDKKKFVVDCVFYAGTTGTNTKNGVLFEAESLEALKADLERLNITYTDIRPYDLLIDDAAARGILTAANSGEVGPSAEFTAKMGTTIDVSIVPDSKPFVTSYGSEVKPKEIEWSQIKNPDGITSNYTHTTCDTPLGRFIIDWKGWKEDPDHDLWLDGKHLKGNCDLQMAKDYAREYLEMKFEELKQFLS